MLKLPTAISSFYYFLIHIHNISPTTNLVVKLSELLVALIYIHTQHILHSDTQMKNLICERQLCKYKRELVCSLAWAY